MEVTASKSAISLTLDERALRNYKHMLPNFKRTCLSAGSVITGRHNVEDVPLGAKLPCTLRYDRSHLYTTNVNLCEKLHLPSCNFDRTYPRDVYLSNEYRCLHDPHLKKYFAKQPYMRRRLYRNKYITSERKVVCSLKEYNLYRQYLKRLSLDYLNKKYLEQYEEGLRKKTKEICEQIRKKQTDVDNPINKRLGKARDRRKVMEKDLAKRRSAVHRKDQEDREKRERNEKENQLRRIINEENREKEREQNKLVKAKEETEKIMMIENLLNIKHEEDLQRRKIFEAKLKEARKRREKFLAENYERKRQYHHWRLAELKRLLADEDVKRRARITCLEKYFMRKHVVLQDALRLQKQKDRESRDKRNQIIEERLKARGWTGSPHTPRTQRPDSPVQRGKGDGEKPTAIAMAKKLSALGFHNAMIAPDILKAMFSIENKEDLAERSSGDATHVRRTLSDQARIFCDDLLRQGFASEYVRQIVDVALGLESTSKDLVAQVIDVSRNVLLPMLESYEKKTGVIVSTREIPNVLQELCSGVFDEEEDMMPQLISFQDGGKATVPAGKESNVRFVVSNTDLPIDYKSHRNRPPTPKRVKFSSSSSEDLLVDEFEIDPHIVIEETIECLSSKVVDHAFSSVENLPQEIERQEMQDRITALATSIVDEVILFGVEKQPSSSSSERSSMTSLERKISHLARNLVTEVVSGEAKALQDSDSRQSSASTTGSSISSDISILALRVVRSILGTVDPATGKTVRDHVGVCQDLEEKVAKLSAKVVEEVMKEKEKQVGYADLDEHGYAELEEKISRLALNIVTSAVGGKPPLTWASGSTVFSDEIEDRVSDLSARIIGAILSLKKILPPLRPAQKTTESSQSESSIDRVLKEIFNLEALQTAPKDILEKITERDVERISDDFARKLVPRDESSAVSSGISELAEALAGDALKNAGKDQVPSIVPPGDDIIDALARAVVDERVSEPKVASCEESKISSAISEATNAVMAELLAGADTSTFLSSTNSNLSNAINEIAEIIVQGTIGQGTSTESALSSGVSKLAGAMAENAIFGKQTSSQSTLSSGTSRIAGALTAEAISTVGGKFAGNVVESSTSSGLESGISELAGVAVTECVGNVAKIDSSTRSAISSGIKSLAEQIALRAIEIAATEQGAEDSTGSGIDSGANKLATHIATVITGQGSVSTTTLESILGTAVSDMVADILTKKVREKMGERDPSSTRSHEIADEVNNLIQNILRSNVPETVQSKTSLESKASAGTKCSSEVLSGVSDFASDVLRELLTSDGNQIDAQASEEEMGSAVNAVAARYVQQVLGNATEDFQKAHEHVLEEALEEIIQPVQAGSANAMLPRQSETFDEVAPSHSDGKLRRESTPPKSTTSLSRPTHQGTIDVVPSTHSDGAFHKIPSPPKSPKSSSSLSRAGHNKCKSVGSLSTRRERNRRPQKFKSSFADWRQQEADTRKKSLARLAAIAERRVSFDNQRHVVGDFRTTMTLTTELGGIMDNLASRIVSSVILNEQTEDGAATPQIGQDVQESQSVEQLVGQLALGVVTSLLGLDTLAPASNLRSSTGNVAEKSARADEDMDTNDRADPTDILGAPDPSARPRSITGYSDSELHVDPPRKVTSSECERILGILCLDDDDFLNTWSSDDTSCEDNALEHPHRVRSPVGRANLQANAKKPKGASLLPRVNNWLFNKTPKPNKSTVPHGAGRHIRKSLCEITPLKPSAGFLSRSSLAAPGKNTARAPNASLGKGPFGSQRGTLPPL